MAGIESDDDKLQYFNDVSAACGPLVTAAQRLDFARNTESLAGTEAETAAAVALQEAFQNPVVPDEVKGIYSELYGADLVEL